MQEKKNIYAFVRHALHPYRYWLLLQFFNVIVWSLLHTAGANARRNIINLTKDLTPGFPTGNVLIGNLTFLIFIGIGWTLSYRLHDYVWRHVQPNLKRYVIQCIMDQLSRHSHRFYQQNLTGALGNRVREISDKLPRLVEQCIDVIWGIISTFFVVMLSLYSVSFTFVAILSTWIFCFLLTSWWAYPHIKKMNGDVAAKNNNIMGHIVDVMSNLMSVRFFASRKKENHLINNKLDHNVKLEQKRDWFMLCFHLFQGLLFVIHHGMIIWFLLNYFEKGLTNAGDFIFVIDMTITIAITFWPFTDITKQVVDSWSFIQQGYNIIFEPIELTDPAEPVVITNPQGAIAYNNLTFKHEKAQPIFNGLNISIPAGQHVALLGHSGSGKTTFVNLLLRLFDVNKGAITIDGNDIRDLRQDDLRNMVSIVMQEGYLFQRTILENIQYSRQDASEEEVIAAARKAYAHDFISALPLGYHTMIGERGSLLSGGQRQRITIARAFLKKTPILIMDEATSQLDPNTDILIQKSLNDLRNARKQTTLIITHRPNTLLNVDRILVFEKGNIVEDGTHEELLAANGSYKQFWKQDKISNA